MHDVVKEGGRAAADQRLNVLILCTGNSARSIMAEAVFNCAGRGRFRAFSAGSKPVGRVNPFAIEQIKAAGMALPECRSKSWLEFAGDGAPQLDFVITVCDNAAGEICPAFSGDYTRIHWGLPDPADYSDEPERARIAFADCFATLKVRVESLHTHAEPAADKQQIAAIMQQLG
ncbi:arsenate reductase ArsC [Mariprofundus ferrooxydans]|uniref:arsenate reductase ArsC n=1 Tax=Mariprofundus ferrooxydans TaxID=314344 RepID=UPI001431440C|nr:arsenate reductase ArsC [Mariprofundus ferrooxydans]